MSECKNVCRELFKIKILHHMDGELIAVVSLETRRVSTKRSHPISRCELEQLLVNTEKRDGVLINSGLGTITSQPSAHQSIITFYTAQLNKQTALLFSSCHKWDSFY